MLAKTKSPLLMNKRGLFMVRMTGLEPTQYCYH